MLQPSQRGPLSNQEELDRLRQACRELTATPLDNAWAPLGYSASGKQEVAPSSPLRRSY